MHAADSAVLHRRLYHVVVVGRLEKALRVAIEDERPAVRVARTRRLTSTQRFNKYWARRVLHTSSTVVTAFPASEAAPIESKNRLIRSSRRAHAEDRLTAQ